MGKSIVDLECFIGALLDTAIQQTIKCEFNCNIWYTHIQHCVCLYV